MEFQEMQDEDAMSLRDEDWSSWRKKEGMQTWTMRHETNSLSLMEIWNSKSSGNMYFEFEEKFGAFSKVHFRQSIYCFEALEVMILMLQTIHKSELKRGCYARLKQTDKRKILSSKFTMHFEPAPWFWIGPLSSTYEFKIDLELTQISNLATSDRVWASRHVKTSSKCLYPIQKALYSFKTCSFRSFFRFFFYELFL